MTISGQLVTIPGFFALFKLATDEYITHAALTIKGVYAHFDKLKQLKICDARPQRYFELRKTTNTYFLL